MTLLPFQVSNINTSFSEYSLGLDVEDLDKLYPLYFCKKNKCSIIYADKQQEEYEKLLQAKLKLKEIYSDQTNLNLGLMETATKEDATKSKESLEKETYFDKKEEYYVDAIMQEINPKFSIIPTGLYKTIVAVSEPQHIKGTGISLENFLFTSIIRYCSKMENKIQDCL